jgi:cell division protein FtsQ
MWDNPRLLNAAAGFLVGMALLAFALAGVQLVLRSPLFALRAVEVRTPLREAPRDSVEAVIRGHVDGNFFAARIGELRDALEQLPWVRKVDVRRVFPDRLEIFIEEHVAFARWGEVALVNTHGERFAGHARAALPLFIAPDGTEAEVTRRYQRFAALLAPLDSALERVVLTPRYAWQLRLGNGLQVMLGRDAELAEERLQRFVEVYARTVGGVRQRHDYVDLRYPNGFALRVKG